MRRRLDLLGALAAVGLDARQFALRRRLLGEDVVQLAFRLAQRELRLAQRAVEVGIALALGAHGALGFVQAGLRAGDQHADTGQPLAHLGDLLVGRQVALALGFVLGGQFGQLFVQALLLLAVALDRLRQLEHLHLHGVYALLAVGHVLARLADFLLLVGEVLVEHRQPFAGGVGVAGKAGDVRRRVPRSRAGVRAGRVRSCRARRK